MKNKLILLLFFMVWMFQHVFSVLYYHIERKACHEINFSKVLNKYADKKAYQFKFSKHQKIDWEKYGKEFFLNEELYDVVAIQTVKDTLHITCFKDKKETKIVHNFKRVHKHSGKGKNQKTPIKKPFYLSYFLTNEHDVQVLFPLLKNSIVQSDKYRLHDAFYAIFKPPPLL